MLKWVSISPSKYYTWQKRKDMENQHNGSLPKSHWLLPWEIDAIIAYRRCHWEEGYRRLSYMMLDEDVVAVSPTSVYRVLKQAGLLARPWQHSNVKGKGFTQPTAPHQQWHLDISYINFRNTFVYLVALVDGYSRYLVHHALRFSVEALDVEILVERARAKFPGVNPILISDNGPQFIAKEFKNYLNLVGITHRRTRFYYPASNGKIERFFKTCKSEAVRRQSYLSFEDLQRQLQKYIDNYNHKRLHSSLGYVTPWDKLQGNENKIFSERKEKLKRAYENRRQSQIINENSFHNLGVVRTTERGQKSGPSAARRSLS